MKTQKGAIDSDHLFCVSAQDEKHRLVASHKAVLLKMKNEQRASLLIIDARLTAENTIQSFHETAGSNSRWSDGRRTYVLLFQGSEQDMRAYMTQMGIVHRTADSMR
jgi:hypothetical protein